MSKYHEYRCACGKLLFKGMLLMSAVQIKCRSCHQVRMIRALNDDLIGDAATALVLDAQGRIVNFSANLPSITGYADAELEGMSAFTLNPVISPNLYRRLWRERLDEPSSQATIFFRKKDGSFTEAASEFKFVSAGDDRYLFILVDFSGQRRFNEVPPWIGSRPGEIYLELDADGKCRSSVMRGVEQLGYSPATLVGTHIGSLCPAMRSETAVERWKQRGPFDLTVNEFLNAHGEAVPVESYFMPSYEHGTFSGFWVASWIVQRS